MHQARLVVRCVIIFEEIALRLLSQREPTLRVAELAELDRITIAIAVTNDVANLLFPKLFAGTRR